MFDTQGLLTHPNLYDLVSFSFIIDKNTHYSICVGQNTVYNNKNHDRAH